MMWYFAVLRRFVRFGGRAHRAEFWMFVLVNSVVSLLLGLLDAFLHTQAQVGFNLLGTAYDLAVALPSLAVGSRRLHDTHRTGWWLLIGIIPIIGWIVLLVFFVRAGDPGPNSYGPDPGRPRPVEVKRPFVGGRPDMTG